MFTPEYLYEEIKTAPTSREYEVVLGLPTFVSCVAEQVHLQGS